MRALVIGGGIGGLAAAIALGRGGIEVSVYEQALDLEEVGFGLTLAPNGVVAAERLGVADAVRAVGARASRIRIPSSRGDVLWELDLAAHGWEGVGVHRADLQRILREALPEQTLHLARRCVSIREEPGRVVADFADGGEAAGDILIGADGMRSVVRSALFGDERLRYGGHVGWRAAVPFTHELVTGTWSETWGPKARVGIVPIGGGRIYLYVAEDVPEGAPDYADPEGEFRRRFAEWPEPIPGALTAAAPGSFSRTFIFDRKPPRRLGRGRITLVGDAAHPMRPDIGQGAAAALEDAVVLGNAVGAPDTLPEEALRRYERCRRKRAGFLVRRSRQSGRFAQASSGPTARVRDAVFRAVPDRVKVAQYARQIWWDADCGRD